MQVPAFLLRRLYVKGSLRNENGGFAFDLKKLLGSGHAEQVLPLTVDGESIAVESAAFIVAGETIPFDAVSSQRPITLGMHKTVTITVNGQKLPRGKRKKRTV